MNNKNVVMSNKIIKGRYSFTKEEQNFIYSVISKISANDVDFQTYRIDFNEQSELYKTTKNYKRFTSFAESLICKPIKIIDGDKTIVCSWLSCISHQGNNSYIDCSFDPHLKPYLLELKKEFVQAKLPTLLSFKSKYSSRLYLLLKSDYDRQKKHKINLVVVYDVIDLIKQFEMPKSCMQRYSKFKEFILEVALDEINTITSLGISYKELKTGRKITSIEFCISHKEKTESQLRKEIEETKPLSDYLPYGLNNKAVEVLLNEEINFKKHDLKHFFEHYKTEDIEQICYELFNCWDSPKLMSREGFFRGKLKLLNKKKTENLSLNIDPSNFFDVAPRSDIMAEAKAVCIYDDEDDYFEFLDDKLSAKEITKKEFDKLKNSYNS
jgi:plasmid replication initiation protein